MYHQVKLHPEAVKYFGFSVEDEHGRQRFYVYLVLAFGVAPAVFITDKLTKPVKTLCFIMAIILNLYIDDGLTIGLSFKSCSASYSFSVFLLRLAGWSLQEAKCISTPVQRIQYLGYIFDSRTMRVSVDDSKCERVVQMVSAIKQCFNNHVPVPCRQLAALCGLLAHLIISHGSFISVVSRHSNHCLGKAVSMNGWESSLQVTVDMLVELDICTTNIYKLNGQPLIREAAVVATMHPSQVNLLLEGVDPLDQIKQKHVFVSDSSDSKAYFFKSGDVKLVDEYLFHQSEQDLSSSFRELLAVSKAFEWYSSYFKSLSGSLLVWATDSTSLVSFLEKGSRIPAVQKEVIKIKKLEYDFGLKIRAKWISRNDALIQQADLGSKIHLCSDQYGICMDDFELVQKFVNKTFSVDGFASAVSRKTLKFIAPCPQIGAIDVDFFSHTLSSSEFYFLHPPPKLLVRLVSKLSCYANVKGVIILPIWRSHSFWSHYVQQGKFVWFVKKFFIFSPCYISHSRNTMFQGRKKFSTLAVEFDTSAKHHLDASFFNNF